MKSNLLRLTIIFMIALPSMLHAQESISNGVLAGGSGKVNDQSFIMQATIGQPIIGLTSNGNDAVHSGFWYGLGEITTSVEEMPATVPAEFDLKQNYPNPFNPSTTIRYSIASATRIVLRVYDILGRQVATLVDEDMQPGNYKTTFSAVELPSGVYFYQIQAGDFQRVRKLMVVK